MSNITEIFKRLQVYKERLFTMQCSLGQDSELQEKIDFYQREIDEMEGEILVEDLKYELDINNSKTHSVITDCWETVDMLCREERVMKMDIKWSWKFFKWMFHVEFYYKKRF